ncbi:hypothetical protein MRX96_029449 [Rhipicephalus microplus]
MQQKSKPVARRGERLLAYRTSCCAARARDTCPRRRNIPAARWAALRVSSRCLLPLCAAVRATALGPRSSRLSSLTDRCLSRNAANGRRCLGGATVPTPATETFSSCLRLRSANDGKKQRDLFVLMPVQP